mmetsp:Transcript_14396/g.36707  ORF Transcript_14396/g.36707 Transcript_14396/m.36707 type:complete len:317 (-) Transcript_14396:1238-2188(-)
MSLDSLWDAANKGKGGNKKSIWPSSSVVNEESFERSPTLFNLVQTLRRQKVKEKNQQQMEEELAMGAKPGGESDINELNLLFVHMKEWNVDESPLKTCNISVPAQFRAAYLMSIFLCTTSRLQFLWQSKAIEFYIPSALSPSVFAPFSSYLISQQELRKPEHKFVNISSKDTLKQALSCISFECRQMIDIIESVPQEGVVSIQRDITNVMSMCSLLLDALSDDGRLLAARIANIYEKKYERISKTSCTQVADGGMVQEDLLKMLESSACVNLLEWNYDSASLAMERLLALSLRSEPKPHQKNVNNDNIDQRHAKEK